MSEPQLNPNPTGDWRKYPKGPNFLGIVIGAAAAIILLLAAAYFLLHRDSGKLLPANTNPTPNSLVRPLLPGPVAPVAG